MIRPVPAALRSASVLILGLGETGLSVARYARYCGAARIRAADTRSEPPGAAQLRDELPGADVCTGPFTPALLGGIDLVVISPGVPAGQPLIAQARERGLPVVGDIELFALALPRDDHAKVIAVTGTNGKTTVTALAGAMLRTGGLDAEVAGNIGPAALDALLRRLRGGGLPQAWVLELSSYQLEHTESLRPDAATMLNLSEDHLDRYAGIAEYAAAKARIFDGGGVQVLNRDDAASMGMRRPGRDIVTFGLNRPPSPLDYGVLRERDAWILVRGSDELCPAASLRLAGTHNIANALAAWALADAVRRADAASAAALAAFAGLPHRMEAVTRIDGVTYYDDSKGTNVGSTVAALRGLGEPLAASDARVVLIAGGDGKGQDFAPLAEPVRRFARAVILIGRDADKIASALGGAGVPCVRAADMAEAVQAARARARSGDAVLLSPACASFDMFRNYAHRAEVFVAAVRGACSGEIDHA